MNVRKIKKEVNVRPKTVIQNLAKAYQIHTIDGENNSHLKGTKEEISL